jgi:leader peptidase (prepilin peptidase)/N-methyltransferase
LEFAWELKMTPISSPREDILSFILPVVFGSVVAGLVATLAIRKLIQSNRISFAITIVATVFLGIWAALVVPHGLLLVATGTLAWALLVLSAVDAAIFRLPDIVTLPLLALGLAVSWLLPDRDLTGHAIGALCGAGAFYLIAEIYRRTRGHEGLGLGDVKLAGAAGAWLGWQALPSMVLLACCAGLVWVGVGVLRRGKSVLEERIPFGVALCFGIWIVWLYGPLEIFGPLN